MRLSSYIKLWVVIVVVVCAGITLALWHSKQVLVQPYMHGTASAQCSRVTRQVVTDVLILERSDKDLSQVKLSVFCDERIWAKEIAGADPQNVDYDSLARPSERSVFFCASRMPEDRFSQRLAILKALARTVSSGDRPLEDQHISSWLDEERLVEIEDNADREGAFQPFPSK